jgi:hypothetical protein
MSVGFRVLSPTNLVLQKQDKSSWAKISSIVSSFHDSTSLEYVKLITELHLSEFATFLLVLLSVMMASKCRCSSCCFCLSY